MGQTMFTKYIVVVDDDVDVHNTSEVLFRLCANTDPQREAAEIVLHFRVARGVHREISRREKREQHQSKHAARQREGREPAGEESGRHQAVHATDVAGRQCAQRHALHERREHAGDTKDATPSPLHVVLLRVVFAEDERRAAQHDAQQHRRQRNVQRGHHGRERCRPGGEQEHDDEDEPDVVRFPNRADGFGDEVAAAAGARAGGEHVPDARAKIRAAHQRVEDERDEGDKGDEVFKSHEFSPPSPARFGETGASTGTRASPTGTNTRA